MAGHRSIASIAREIERDWKKPYYGAVPYLRAMRSLNSIDDHYGLDSASEVVNYFLANATSWRGETARRIKAELKSMMRTGRDPSRRKKPARRRGMKASHPMRPYFAWVKKNHKKFQKPNGQLDMKRMWRHWKQNHA